MSKKSTGMGPEAFFSKSPESPVDSAPDPARRPKQVQPKRIRTTVVLHPSTMAAMNAIKTQNRLEGIKVTYSDILDEAVQLLVAEKGLAL